MEWTRNRTSHRVVILDLYLGYLAPMGAPLLVPRMPIVASPKSILPPLAARVQREQEEAARKAKQHHVEHLKRMEEEAAKAKREEEARETRRARTPVPVPVAPRQASVPPSVPPLPPAPPAGITSPADRGTHSSGHSLSQPPLPQIL
jgi:hypothetical protein